MGTSLLDQALPSSWGDVLSVVVFSVVVYAFVIASHRLVGKRAASQMNNFDWIVTVAMGAVMGSTILAKSVSLVEGLVAVATLLALQYAVTRATVQWPRFKRAVQAGPRLLYYEGIALEDVLKSERVTESEVLHAARDAGHRSLSEVAAVVLEADGTLSVLPASSDGVATAAVPLLSDVRGLPDFVPPIDDPSGVPERSEGTDADGGSGDEESGAEETASGTLHKNDGR